MIIDMNNLVIGLNDNFKTIAVVKMENTETGEEKYVVRIDFIDKTSVCLESTNKTLEESRDLLNKIKEALKENKHYLKITTYPIL